MMFLAVGGCGAAMLQAWLPRLAGSDLTLALDRPGRKQGRLQGVDHVIALHGIRMHGSRAEYAEAARAEVARAVEEQWPQIDACLDKCSSIVLLAGLGGVVGSWGAVEIGNRLVAGSLDVTAMLVMPFAFERDRVKVARSALAAMPAFPRQVLCRNDDLIRHAQKGASMKEAFSVMNDEAWDLLFGGGSGYQTHVTS